MLKIVLATATTAFVLGAYAAPAVALTVTEAITATTEAGYSAVAVKTSRDGTVTSVLATDGESYYEIDYDTDTGEETSTTEVTAKTSSFDTLSDSDTSAAITAAEDAGLTVVGVRSTDSGVEVLATDGTTTYSVSYDSETDTTTTTEATRGGKGGKGGRHGKSSTETTETTDTTEDSTEDTTEDTSDESSDDSSDDESSDDSSDESSSDSSDRGGRDGDRGGHGGKGGKGGRH